MPGFLTETTVKNGALVGSTDKPAHHVFQESLERIPTKKRTCQQHESLIEIFGNVFEHLMIVCRSSPGRAPGLAAEKSGRDLGVHFGSTMRGFHKWEITQMDD